MKKPGRRLVFSAIAATLVAVVAWAAEPPKGLIANFRLPFFSREGFRTGELRGTSARYLDGDRVEVTGVQLRSFSGDETGAVTMEISTPIAIVQTEAANISGPEQIEVKSESFELFGTDWIYEHNEKSMVIQRDVVVTFNGSIGDILR